MPKSTLKLFEAFGIELEYMVVDRDTLRPSPIAETILKDGEGNTVQEISLGPIDVSNELATHVLEFKSSGPTANLEKLESDFHAAIREMNERLAAHNAMLAPTGIHPFMDPKTEGKTWSQGDRTIYDTYDRIFDCHRHGWLNLQSCHLNLPFANEEEFARLHAAIILILPYLPALTASSPYIEGRHDGFLDTRLKVYSTNQAKVPEIAGNIVPEPVFTFAEYQSEILQKTYAAIAPLDPEGILQEEWLNSRGAITRFDRNAIEIRILDTQENPSRDIAVCSLIITLLKKLTSLKKDELIELATTYSPEQRKQQLMAVAESGLDAPLQLKDLAELFGLTKEDTTICDFWEKVFDSISETQPVARLESAICEILEYGSLAQRMMKSLGESPTQDQLADTLRDLASCLANGNVYPPSR